MIDPKAINVKRTRKALESAAIKPITSLGLSMETDISSDDPAAVSRGETHLNNALTVARDLGSTMLSGVLYSALGKYQKASTDIGRWNCVSGPSTPGRKSKGIGHDDRQSNRSTAMRANLINSGDDALSLIEAIGADNMVVHLDSYHMNIEEGAPGPLIERLGKRLGYVHVNESHRGHLGTGSIDFS